jgi:divalent metal cation (Fe/Co/Zn/Cd) transporter
MGWRPPPPPAPDAAPGTGVTVAEPRDALLRHALRLEYLTVGWNVVEGIVAVAAAAAAGSVALLGFGIDSFVESASGIILVWRLHAERRAADERRIEQVERRARRLVALSLALLAAYVAVEATTSLAAGERPEASPVGLALAVASLVVMWWLARAKRRAAVRLGSRAMGADAFQTEACFWLSVFLLVGIGANAAFGIWWADAVAALGMTVFIGREALEAWRGETGEADEVGAGGAG